MSMIQLPKERTENFSLKNQTEVCKSQGEIDSFFLLFNAASILIIEM